MRDRLPQDDALGYDARFRCRYCGAPCRDGGVCVAHSDVHRLDDETEQGLVQLSVDDVIALEAADTGEAAQATKGKGSR